VLPSSAVDHEFEPWSCQTKHYAIGICCFSAKHAALRSVPACHIGLIGWSIGLQHLGGLWPRCIISLISVLILSFHKSSEIDNLSEKTRCCQTSNLFGAEWNQNIVSDWSDMSTHRLLFQYNTIQIQLTALVKYKANIFIILSKCFFFCSHDITALFLTIITHSLNKLYFITTSPNFEHCKYEY
jgi:hypothetical protein